MKTKLTSQCCFIVFYIFGFIITMTVHSSTFASTQDECISGLKVLKNRETSFEHWKSLYDTLSKKTNGEENPFLSAGFDDDSIAMVHELYRQALPGYEELVHHQERDNYSVAEAQRLKALVMEQIEAITNNPKANMLSNFAALEAVRRMAVVETRTRYVEVSDSEESKKQKEKDEKRQEKRKEDKKKRENKKEEKKNKQDQQGQQKNSGGQGQEQQQQEQQKDQSEDDDNQNDESNDDDDTNQETQDWEPKTEQYEPFNKRLDEKKLKKSKGMYLVRTDAKLKNQLLRQNALDVVTSKHLVANTVIRPVLTRQSSQNTPASSKALLKITTTGSKEIHLGVPYGYSVEDSRESGVKLDLSSEGNSELKITTSTVPASVDLSIIQSQGYIRTQFQGALGERAYTRHSDISDSVWPKEVLDFINALKQRGLTGSGQRLEIAAELEKFFKTTGGYKYYSVGKNVTDEDLDKVDELIDADIARGIPKPVAMAKAKFFNCDGAAWIMTLILKDFFQIPARVALGRTIGGKIQEKDSVSGKIQVFSVVRKQDPRHAWVEVWNGDEWVPFDPTPPWERKSQDKDKQDKDSDKNNEQSKSQDSQDSSDDQNQKSNQSSKKSKDKNDGDDESSEESTPEKSLEDQKKQAKENKGKTSKTKGDQKNKTDNDDKSSDEPKADTPDESSKSNIKSSELKPKLKISNPDPKKLNPDLNKWIDIISKSIELQFLEESIDKGGHVEMQEQALAALTQFAEKLTDEQRPLVKGSFDSILKRIAYFSERSDANLRDSLKKIMIWTGDGKYREAWSETKAWLLHLKAIAELRNLKPSEQSVLNGLERLYQSFSLIRHKDSPQYDLVKRILDKVPGKIVRKFVDKHYGNVLELGSLALDRFANDLMSGKLSRLVLMSFVYDYARMVLATTSEPAYGEEKTFYKSPVPKRQMNDLVMADSVSEFNRMILDPRPGEHLFEKLFRREQFALGSKETRLVAIPHKPLERKVSVVEVDISGSMAASNRLDAQEALISCFLDIALSERDKMNLPLHQVYLIRFNHQVFPAEAFLHPDAAFNHIEKYILSGISTKYDGSTDIQAPLEKFFDIVGDAYRPDSVNGNRKLKKANLVLFTDGEATVNIAKIKERAKQVPEGVRVFMNFTAVGNTSETLEKLAKESNISSTKPMVKKLLDADIAQLMAKLSLLQLDENSFATSKGAFEAPSEMIVALQDLTHNLVPVTVFNSSLSDVEVKTLRTKTTPSKFSITSSLASTGSTLVNLFNRERGESAIGLKNAVEAITSAPIESKDLKKRLFEGVASCFLSHYGNQAASNDELTSLRRIDAWAFQ